MNEDPNYADLEARLRALKSTIEPDKIEITRLLAKGRRQVAARDAMTFGFTHLLQSFLTLFSVLYRAGHAQPRRNES
jgi:hypothetical protein